MSQVYHYTCHHAAQRITQDMIVQPNTAMALPVSWWTDLEYPDRAALGLTSHALDCDRTDVRVTAVSMDYVVRWGMVRSSAPRHLVDVLELAPGAAPAHWFVSHVPVPVRDITPVRALSR